MRFFRLFVFAAGLLGWCLLTACQRQATAAASPSLSRVLYFGSGGGFAGTSTRYSLHADGRLERQQGAPGGTAPAPVAFPTQPAAVVAKYFKAFDALPADSLTLQQPGNMYYFLEGQTAAGRRVALTWGANGAPVSRAAQSLYDELQQLLAEKN